MDLLLVSSRNNNWYDIEKWIAKQLKDTLVVCIAVVLLSIDKSVLQELEPYLAWITSYNN